jgi:hypothetical protein
MRTRVGNVTQYFSNVIAEISALIKLCSNNFIVYKVINTQ